MKANFLLLRKANFQILLECLLLVDASISSCPNQWQGGLAFWCFQEAVWTPRRSAHRRLLDGRLKCWFCGAASWAAGITRSVWQQGDGLGQAGTGLLPTLHLTVLQVTDKTEKILKAASWELLAPWESLCLSFWCSTKTVYTAFDAIKTWSIGIFLVHTPTTSDSVIPN